MMSKYSNVDFEKLNIYLNSLIDYGFPSFDCIVMHNHEMIYRNYKGFSDIEKKICISNDNLYYFYSLTKLITAVSALQLAEKGLLKLDDYVYKYIPTFFNQKVNIDGEIVDSPQQIKIIDLLTMTSGVGYGYWDKTIKNYLCETGDSSTYNVVSAFGKSVLEFIPGKKWCYGFSMDIVAAIIEYVSGLLFSDYVKKFIFDPLCMNDSSFRIDDISRLAKLYEFDDDNKCLFPVNQIEFDLGKNYCSGGGGLISSSWDYAKFADCLACNGIGINGDVILSSSSVKLMRSNALDADTLSYFRRFGDGQYTLYGYGLGVRTRMVNNNETHGPIGEFGWGGASGSLVFIDPNRNLSLLYSQHSLNNHEEITLPKLRDVFFECIEIFEADNR